MKKEKELDENFIEIKEKLRKTLRAGFYMKVESSIDNLLKSNEKLKKEYDKAIERENYWKAECYKEREKISDAENKVSRYQEYYKEVCRKQAEKIIEIDILNEKLNLLKKGGQVNDNSKSK